MTGGRADNPACPPLPLPLLPPLLPPHQGGHHDHGHLFLISSMGHIATGFLYNNHDGFKIDIDIWS